MHLNILSDSQQELLPFLATFKREFILVGGTAIALQIGHRMSIDFDLFKQNVINKRKIKEKVNDLDIKKQLLFEDGDGIHFLINDVKMTFFQYPFPITGTVSLGKSIKMPDLLTLTAMKFYAMGRRAKWKDYVDIYCLLNKGFTIEQVSKKALELFGDAYSEKLFRQQLCYFEDIDYSETVEWIADEVSNEDIKSGLIAFSLSF